MNTGKFQFRHCSLQFHVSFNLPPRVHAHFSTELQKPYARTEHSCWNSANDHLAKEISLLRKVLHQFILCHPDKILALPNVQLVRCNHLRLEKELLNRGK